VSVLLFTAAWFARDSAGAPPPAENFRASQKKIERVKNAYDLKWPGIKKKLSEMKIDTSSFELFIRGFKEEKQIEVWVKNKNATTWSLYTTYAICASSGEAGPKRCQGDGQVPEGFYHVNTFNPYSNYLLSLGVSYPNSSDKVFACRHDPGGAIMIHGNCVTIGCIPITDDKIRELYVMAVEAKADGQEEIPIHLFPARMTKEKTDALKKSNPDPQTGIFWDNLKEGYDKFEAAKTLPVITVNKAGKYIFG
ncbi:MAG TPA: L,D-transpeptidase family protein, partial [Bacteroidia bacterium]|nr:L,D-transpeptidase family protein [Bacteroidia bacterium]